MSTWVAWKVQPLEFTVIVPTLELVRRAGISGVQGVRLSNDHLAVEDGDFFHTRFCRDKSGRVFARVIDPSGDAEWFKECPEIEDTGWNLLRARSVAP